MRALFPRHFRFSCLLPLLVLSACATSPEVGYKLSPEGPLLTKSEAQAEHAALDPKVAAGSPLTVLPKVITSYFPDYPRSWRNADINGLVRVVFDVDVNGTVANPTIAGSPPPELAALALHAIMRWKFEPAKRDGAPVRSRVSQDFNFVVR